MIGMIAIKAGVVISVLLTVQYASAQSVWKKVKDGNKLYQQGKYEEAVDMYRQAVEEEPEFPPAHYNLGNALFRSENLPEALQEFEKVILNGDDAMNFRSYYNMGNALYRMGRYGEAVQSYKRALKLNPDDFESKHNLEVARRKLQKQQQQQQQGQNQEDRESNEEQESESGQQNQDVEQPRQEPLPDVPEMSKEEAVQILNALQEQEKDLLEKRKAEPGDKIRVEKPW